MLTVEFAGRRALQEENKNDMIATIRTRRN
jgi:hypothetical protein